MSKVKTLLGDDFEDTPEIHDNGFWYPGEEEIESFRQAFNQHELSHYTTSELQEEVWRRQEEPIRSKLENTKAMISNWQEQLRSY